MRSIDLHTALHRFGLGPAPGEASRIGGDVRGWLKAQTSGTARPSAEMAEFPPSAETLREIHLARTAGGESLKKLGGTLYRQRFIGEVMARARHMIATDKPFAERMVAFWSNHFTVSTTRRIIAPAIPAYEREAIRPHVFGRFADMLKAVCRHPCMTSYLDNVFSMGPASPAGRRQTRRKGNEKTLNENLAREILELHTLGVNGGYGQHDVIELAKAISGWTHGGARSGRDQRPVHGDFEFRAESHEPGPKTVLGKNYAENGVDEGLAVLDDLARHPSTARFIAGKLVRHFVADAPPAAAVERIAAEFMDSDGDLARVCHALIDLDACWRNPLSKAKSHYELVIATHRATGARDVGKRELLAPLRELGQVPFAAPSPQGWGDTTDAWVTPEALMHRIRWLRQQAARLPGSLRPDRLLDDLIGPVASDATRTWVGRAPSGDAAIAMVLASPEFQRR
ncbi:MAG: DUF1800 domain-containing protein [Burkholderiaceae bacterium]